MGALQVMGSETSGRGSGQRSLDEVRRELGLLAARIAGATCEFLTLLAELDRRDGWAGYGITSCAHWLSIHCGLSSGTAREQVRVARALQRLPLIRDAFAAGRLSFSKVRALTRVAGPDDEADLLTVALSASANQLERLVSGIRRAESLADVNLRHARRSLSWREEEDGSFVFSARCGPEDAAAIIEALRSVQDQSAPDVSAPDVSAQDVSAETSDRTDDGVSAETSTPGAALLDALVTLCTHGSLPGAPTSESAPALGSRRSETVLHVTLDDLTSAARSAPRQVGSVAGLVGPHLELGPVLHPETARRLTCGSPVRIMMHASQEAGGPTFSVTPSARAGSTINVGRRKRLATPRQLAALWERDQGCRYPGCERRRFLHAHHVTHWADGGRTDLQNLVLLCAGHHRALHEGNYQIQLTDQQRAVSIHDHTGRVIARSGHRPAPRTAAAAANPLLGGFGTPAPAELLPLEPRSGDHLELPYAVGVLAGNREIRRRAG